MNSELKKQTIDNMVDRLSKKMKEYRACTDLDEIFEVKKKLRMEIKELEEGIAELQSQNMDGRATL